MSRSKVLLVPREHATTRAIVRANKNAKSFALSKKRFFGGSPSLTTSIRNASRKQRPITLAERA
jgi:hypothetical protein